MSSTMKTPVTPINILTAPPEKQRMLLELLRENTETVICCYHTKHDAGTWKP